MVGCQQRRAINDDNYSPHTMDSSWNYNPQHLLHGVDPPSAVTLLSGREEHGVVLYPLQHIRHWIIDIQFHNRRRRNGGFWQRIKRDFFSGTSSGCHGKERRQGTPITARRPLQLFMVRRQRWLCEYLHCCNPMHPWIVFRRGTVLPRRVVMRGRGWYRRWIRGGSGGRGRTHSRISWSSQKMSDERGQGNVSIPT